MPQSGEREVLDRIRQGLIYTESVIGAGSVVSRDIPPMVVAVGTPCRVLRPITDGDLTTR